MINIDSLSIKAFLAENIDFFIGARVQKIQQPNRREIILNLRNKGESRKLYLNINPSFYHICFMSKENELKRNIKNPKAPAMFCMLLRKYLDGAKIVSVEQPEFERIFEIYFEYYDALNEKIKLCLAVELMGKHSNIILYNYDTNVIIGCAHNVGSEKSKDRELQGLLPYMYPPRQDKYDIREMSFGDFFELLKKEKNWQGFLVQNFHYITKSLIDTLLSELNISQSYTESQLKQLYSVLIDLIELKIIFPCIDKEFCQFSLYPFKNALKSNSVSDMFDEYFAYHQNLKLVKNLKDKILVQINNQIKKLENLKEKQSEQLKKEDKMLIYKKKGDILMANLHKILPEIQKLILDDFEGNLVEIELDNMLSPVENANRYYKLYKKSKTSVEHNRNLFEETQNRLGYYAEQKFYAQIAHSIEDLEEIFAEITDDSLLQKRQTKEKNISLNPIVIEGYKIFVGKNSAQNDYILSKLASPEDIWFHPLNFAGSHVVLKKNNSKEIVSDDILFKAAKISKEYSVGKSASKVPIVYTLRKYVKKGNSKKQAFVTYKNETEILVD